MQQLRKVVKRITIAGCVALSSLMAILALKAWRFKSRQITIAAAPAMAMDEQQAVERFASAISLKTVSQQNPARVDAEEFDNFRSYLRESYPNVHEQLDLLTGLEWPRRVTSRLGWLSTCMKRGMPRFRPKIPPSASWPTRSADFMSTRCLNGSTAALE